MILDFGFRHKELNEFWQTGDPGYLRLPLVRCEQAIRQLRSDPDPVRRISGLICLAELGLTIRLVVEMRRGPRPCGIPALKSVAATLESDLSKLIRHTDISIVEKILQAIAELRRIPDRSSLDEDPVAPALAAAGGSPFPRARTP